jgi:hypothetical protein
VVREVTPQPAIARLIARIDWFDWLALALLIAQSMWLVALFVTKQHSDHIWIRADGTSINDQAQFLAWVQNAGHGGLISNSFQLSPSRDVFLHPGFVISGALNRAGLSAGYAYLIWKPIAVISLYAAVRAYVRRVLTGLWQRRIALVLALFSVAPFAAALAVIGQDGRARDVDLVSFETWMGRYLWGYPFTAIAVASFIGTLLVYERDRTDVRLRFLGPMLGLLCAWLQPWQGATLFLVLIVSEIIRARRQMGNIPLLVLTATATAAPLVYYTVISHRDASWEHAAEVNRSGFLPWPAFFAGLVLLAVPAALAYRRRPVTFQDIGVRLWPIAALLVYAYMAITNTGTLPPHVLQGITVPLAVLAVIGTCTVLPRLTPRVGQILVVAAVVVLIVPGVGRELQQGRKATTQGDGAFYLRAGDRDALAFLDKSNAAGGVLAPLPIGKLVPGLAGRDTLVGHPTWTDHYGLAGGLVGQIVAGRFSPAQTELLIRRANPRFVLSDCAHASSVGRLTVALRPVLVGAQRFGCATVFEISPVQRVAEFVPPGTKPAGARVSSG